MDQMELALGYSTLTKKDKAKRTSDFMKAILRLQDYRCLIDKALKILGSGEIVHEKLCNEFINMGVEYQGLSTLVRPHTIERCWKIRNDNARRKNKKRKTPCPKTEAWLEIFTAQTVKYTWSSAPDDAPSEAWNEYFKKNHKSFVENEES